MDDFERLGAHMSQRTWRMGFGRMSYVFDEARGRAVGSRIRMSGSARSPALPMALNLLASDYARWCIDNMLRVVAEPSALEAQSSKRFMKKTT